MAYTVCVVVCSIVCEVMRFFFVNLGYGVIVIGGGCVLSLTGVFCVGWLFVYLCLCENILFIDFCLYICCDIGFFLMY